MCVSPLSLKKERLSSDGGWREWNFLEMSSMPQQSLWIFVKWQLYHRNWSQEKKSAKKPRHLATKAKLLPPSPCTAGGGAVKQRSHRSWNTVSSNTPIKAWNESKEPKPKAFICQMIWISNVSQPWSLFSYTLRERILLTPGPCLLCLMITKQCLCILQIEWKVPVWLKEILTTLTQKKKYERVRVV